jgi:hypothetical protein
VSLTHTVSVEGEESGSRVCLSRLTEIL